MLNNEQVLPLKAAMQALMSLGPWSGICPRDDCAGALLIYGY
jgi:hypothetical protein